MQSIVVAISGRVFQGLASDNLLHFSLNSVYVQVKDKSQVSRLIGSSLALYMLGISVGPFIASLFTRFTTSFTVAIGIFLAALFYLLFLPHRRLSSIPADDEDSAAAEEARSPSKSLVSSLRTMVTPLHFFYDHPTTLFSGFAIFLYNAAQSYVFSALMVHTSITFGFSSTQNGFLIAIVHAVGASYLILTLFVLPFIMQTVSTSRLKAEAPAHPRSPSVFDALLAQLSLVMQTASLVLLALMTESWQVYPIAALCALGLATPSFIKSHLISTVPDSSGARAVAASTFAETTGGLLAPVLLGSWQTASPGSGVFMAAAVMLGLASVLFGLGAFVFRATVRWEAPL